MHECFIMVKIPIKMGQRPAPALAKTEVFFPAIFASRSLLECCRRPGGCGPTRQLLLPAADTGAMNLAQCH